MGPFAAPPPTPEVFTWTTGPCEVKGRAAVGTEKAFHGGRVAGAPRPEVVITIGRIPDSRAPFSARPGLAWPRSEFGAHVHRPHEQALPSPDGPVVFGEVLRRFARLRGRVLTIHPEEMTLGVQVVLSAFVATACSP